MKVKSQSRDIRNLLVVLGMAIFCAGLLSFFFIHYYGFSGRYVASQVLLDPAIIKQIHYQDGIKGKIFSFDRIEFIYFDQQKGMIKKEIDLETYQKFYALISNEKSVTPSPSIENAFRTSNPMLLKIYMKTSGSHLVSTLFQVAQFIPENFFRIQLNDKEKGEWVYYYHEDLFQKVLTLFNVS